MEKLYKAVDDVVNYIKLSDEYKNCVSLKDKMSKNQENKKESKVQIFCFIY